MRELKVINKNYGSIGHLSTSKIGQQADKKIALGQEEILTIKARDWKDLIIVTEKIDGSNVGVVIKDGAPVAITRAGYPAATSPHEQHRAFSRYIEQNRCHFVGIPEGWRVCGEWCLQAHGTMMDISKESPFVVFDIITSAEERVPYLHMIWMCASTGLSVVPLLHIGQPLSIKHCIKLLGVGHYGNPERAEGAVWRVEREGRVDFLGKWVNADKEDGKYLGDVVVWNKGAELWL